MSADGRYRVVGLARVRSPWFADVAGWANTSQLPVEFLKCVSAAEADRRLRGHPTPSAFLVEDGAPGVTGAFLDGAASAGTVVIVVGGDRDAHGAAHAVLPPRFTADQLLGVLRDHVDSPTPAGSDDGAVHPTAPAEPIVAWRPIARVATGVAHADDTDTDDTDTDNGDAEAEAEAPTRHDSPRGEPTSSALRATAAWQGSLVAVTGSGGVGTSTLAMALAQGFANLPGNERSVVLVDLARHGDLAMYHHTRDVLPGLQELVEAHRRATPPRAELMRLVFDVADRSYSVAIGVRRARDVERLGRLDTTLGSLRSAFRVVVADVDPDPSGTPSATALAAAGLVVVCGDPTLKGLHGILRTERDLLDGGVDPGRILRIVNRAPRSPRSRSELTAALAELGAIAGGTSPVFLPERRGLEVVHRTGGPIPAALVTPLTRAVASRLAAPG